MSISELVITFAASSVLDHLHIYLDLLEESHLMVTFNNKFELILT